MSKKQSKKATEPKAENKSVEAVKSPDAPQVSTEVKEPTVDPIRPSGGDDATERNERVNDSIQSHSAQVTEGEAAQARADGEDLKSHPLDQHDGAVLDQRAKAEPFDIEKEEKLAHAKPKEQPEAVKNAQVNPNGVGNEWPR